MERTEAEMIAAVLKGDAASFEPLVEKYSPRIFATARRYARRESEVEDIVQEIWLKAFEKLSSFRGEAPFEHWLMRLAVRTCYDSLRAHQRNRETTFSELTEPEEDWLDRFVTQPDTAEENAEAARQLVGRVLEQLSPAGPAGHHLAGNRRPVGEGNRRSSPAGRCRWSRCAPSGHGPRCAGSWQESPKRSICNRHATTNRLKYCRLYEPSSTGTETDRRRPRQPAERAGAVCL